MKYRTITIIDPAEPAFCVKESIMVAENIAAKFYEDTVSNLLGTDLIACMVDEPLVCRSPKDMERTLAFQLKRDSDEKEETQT